MTDFGIAAACIGIVSFSIKLIEMANGIRVQCQNAPEGVKKFLKELQSLLVSLMEIQNKLIDNPTFEEAFETNPSALLSHLKGNLTFKTQIQSAFDNCKKELIQVIEDLKRREQKAQGHKISWDYFKGAIQSRRLENSITAPYTMPDHRQAGLV
jgi:hypothetical protein